MAITTCPNCGEVVDDRSPVCHNCGHSLKNDVSPVDQEKEKRYPERVKKLVQ